MYSMFSEKTCIYVYKCLNGLVEHDMNFIRQQEQHDYITRTTCTAKFHAIQDFNLLTVSQAIGQSVNVNIFKHNLFKFVI